LHVSGKARSKTKDPIQQEGGGGRGTSWVAQTENGSPLRLLTLIDEYTRQYLAIPVAWSIRAVDVIELVEQAMERHGVPGHIRSDNGPEWIAYAIEDWMKRRQIGSLYINPGSLNLKPEQAFARRARSYSYPEAMGSPF